MKRLIIIASCIFLSQISSGQVMMFFTGDSLTNITSPLDLDSLFYWFAADQGVTDSLGGAIATDEGVGTWADLSGNGYHVTQTTNGARPVYKATGGPGSKPCVQFDGSNDFLASAAHFWGSDDISIFAVVKFANATRDAQEFVIAREENGATQWDFRGRQATASYRMAFFAQRDGTGGNNTEDYYNSKTTAYRLYSHVLNSTSTAWIDGASQTVTRATVGTGDGTIFNDSQPLDIGCIRSTSTPILFLQGSISEIIIYSRALTATERAAIENYLNKKYDLY